jgi:hypothetical protein
MSEVRRRRGQWRGWASRTIEQHGAPAVVGLCGGMRVLMVTQGNPAKVLMRPGPHQPVELALDEAGVYVVRPDPSGWPGVGTYVDAFEMECQVHEGHVVDSQRLLDEWFCVDHQLPTGLAVQISALEPQRRANI